MSVHDGKKLNNLVLEPRVEVHTRLLHQPGFWIPEGTSYRPVDYDSDGTPDDVLISTSSNINQEGVENLIPPTEKDLADAREWMEKKFTPEYRQNNTTRFQLAAPLELKKAANGYFLILQNAQKEKEDLKKVEESLGEVIGYSFGTGALGSLGLGKLMTLIATRVFAGPETALRIAGGVLAVAGIAYFNYSLDEVDYLDSEGLISHSEALNAQASLWGGAAGAVAGGFLGRPNVKVVTATKSFTPPSQYKPDINYTAPRLPGPSANTIYYRGAAAAGGGGSAGGTGGGSVGVPLGVGPKGLGSNPTIHRQLQSAGSLAAAPDNSVGTLGTLGRTASLSQSTTTTPPTTSSPTPDPTAQARPVLFEVSQKPKPVVLGEPKYQSQPPLILPSIPNRKKHS